jgi:hypothetical protein
MAFRCDVSSHDVQVVPCRFECFLSVAVRNKPSVVVKGQVALTAEAIKQSQQARMFLVDAGAHKFDYCDVMPRWARARNP